MPNGYRFDTHPNISRGALWEDFVYRQMAPNGSYEEGMVIPLSYYARMGGFDEEARTLETKRLIPKDFGGIRGTSMDTSLRRYIGRFGAYGYGGIWTNESFTANDDCRVNDSGEDISLDTLRHNVDVSLPMHVNFLTRYIPQARWEGLINDCSGFLSGRSAPVWDDELGRRAEHIIRSQVKLAQAVLAKVVALPDLASSMDPEEAIEVAVRERVEEIHRAVRKRAHYSL